MSRRLLIVDDEAHILVALRRSLRGRGLDVTTAESAAEALRVVEEQRIDAVLCDQRMPGISGLDLLAELTSRHPELRAGLLTGLPESVSETDSQSIGLRVLIPKPWDREELLKGIDALLPG